MATRVVRPYPWHCSIVAAREGRLTVDEVSSSRKWVHHLVLILSVSALPVARLWAASYRFRYHHDSN